MARRRPTLPTDDDPLNIILPKGGAIDTGASESKRTNETNAPIANKGTKGDNVSVSTRSGKKVRVAFHLPRWLAEEARNCVYHLSGPPLRLTMAELAERGIAAEIQRLKAEYNHSEPFPHRRADLKGGRPIR